jgi:hypothetical protein
MAEPNIGQVAASAWESIWTDGPVDNVFTSQALLYLFKDGGYQEDVAGGRLFEADVEYAMNGSFASTSEMGVLDTTRFDTFDAARQEQKIWAGTIVFSDLEELRNAPAGRKFDVVKRKLKNGISSAMEGLNKMLYLDGTGSGGLDFDGLAKIISSTPTTGVVAGINAGTWAFWRNKQALGTATLTPWDNLRSSMTSVRNQCSLGGTEKVPTGAVTARAPFEGYESLLVAIERLVKDSDGSAKGDIAFMNDAILFKGLPLVYDEACPSDVLYFVNKNFLKLTVLKGGWMKMLAEVAPANQLSKVHRVMTVGNLSVSARRHLGVVNAIS